MLDLTIPQLPLGGLLIHHPGYFNAPKSSTHKNPAGSANLKFEISAFESLSHNSSLLNRNALAMTETELKVIAALAIIGLSNNPVTGYNTPAATGIPMTL
jgi:hypothetical protein